MALQYPGKREAGASDSEHRYHQNHPRIGRYEPCDQGQYCNILLNLFRLIVPSMCHYKVDSSGSILKPNLQGSLPDTAHLSFGPKYL